jgi:CRISPR-associated endonuclease/helicase Cas3
MRELPFEPWFQTLTGHPIPRGWQADLVAEPDCRNRLIRIPTGLGKTEGVLATWSYHRLHRQDDSWPRRLVWCLPMRGLVEQTVHVARELAERVPADCRPQVDIAMGGEEAGEWFLHPELPAILVGTQDMLLSRALNRGFASARGRWPMEFGLLHHDALWIMDEVQLMDVGLATSAQLQAFREMDQAKSLRPCHTWWMSATLQPSWLRSVDTADYHPGWTDRPCTIPTEQQTGGLWEVSKSCSTTTIDPNDHAGFAKLVLAEHAKLQDSEYGKITLVICNTVERACGTFDALRAAGRTEGLELVHSRFRPFEREGWRERFLCRAACRPDVDRIIVSTQVIEAGVDISASCLITELAPWPSLVQRFGRCARYAGPGNVLVVDRGRDGKWAAPYQSEELESAWETLQQSKDVGLRALETLEQNLSSERRQQLYPYKPTQLLLRQEFDELFDTTPDLTGGDLDISRFIRSGDERDLQLFWEPIAKGEQPSPDRRPQRTELCTVPFLKARDWLCGEETKTNKKQRLRGGMRAWVWDWIDGSWVEATRASLLPGRIVCVASSCGGYRTDRGFDASSKEVVSPIPEAPINEDVQSFDAADDQQDGEQLSFHPWKTIACHAAEVAEQVRQISMKLALPSRLHDLLEMAARWHDWGKAHPAFQGAIDTAQGPARNDLAKGPKSAWRKPPHIYRYTETDEKRPAFRHELASTLGLFTILAMYRPKHDALLGPWSDLFSKLQLPSPSANSPPSSTPLVEKLLSCKADEFDLIAYLIASHHGKVRLGLHASPQDQEYRDRDGKGLPIRGIREGDVLPSVVLVPGEPPIPAVELTLSPAAIGLSARSGISWRERCIGLTAQYGPAALAYLEAILRAADVRASRLNTNDPILAEERKP